MAGSSRQLSNMFCVGGEVKLWFCFLLLERKYWFIWRKWKWLRKLHQMSEKIKQMHSHVFLISSAKIKSHLFSSCCCASYYHKRQTMNIHFFCHYMTWFSCPCLFGKVLWKQKCLLQPIPRRRSVALSIVTATHVLCEGFTQPPNLCCEFSNWLGKVLQCIFNVEVPEEGGNPLLSTGIPVRK